MRIRFQTRADTGRPSRVCSANTFRSAGRNWRPGNAGRFVGALMHGVRSHLPIRGKSLDHRGPVEALATSGEERLDFFRMFSFPPHHHARILLALCLLLPSVASAQPRAPGSIVVRVDGQERVLSPAELAKATRHEQTVTVGQTTATETVSGVLLWDVLQLAGVPSSNASGRQRAVMYVKLTGADGQRAVIALAEIDPSYSQRVFLVADRRNGKPLDGSEGPWRVFIPADMRHARWIRGLASVEILSVE
jgi:hypothetical protein